MEDVTIYVVTYRRATLLLRALRSIVAQTHSRWQAFVINDDPTDPDVERVIEDIADPRISLFRPAMHRGATQNFNVAFAGRASGYITVLEDDNWWEPAFLSEMSRALSLHPQSPWAVCNEKIWREETGGTWVDTGRTTMPDSETSAFGFAVEDLCGSATWCNSAMLIRADAGRRQIPSHVPVDVSEHFFDRTMTGPVIKVGLPLVNFAVTLSSSRSSSGYSWSIYQSLLIGSVFAALPDRRTRDRLAKKLWSTCPNAWSPRAVTLVRTGAMVPAARQLFWNAPPAGIARFLLWAGRRPKGMNAFLGITRHFAGDFEFLRDAPRTRELVARFAATSDGFG